MDIISPNHLLQMKLLGEFFRELREKEKLPLRKVAAFLDIDTSILSKIERGERDLNPQLVVKLASFFDLDQEKILTEFLGEEVAKKIYLRNDISSIFQVAEVKVKYLKNKSVKQGEIEF